MENNLILITCIILMLLAVFVWQYMKFDKKKALTMPKEALRYNDDSILSNTISRWRAAIGSSSTIIVRYFFVFTICLPFCAFALKLICNFTSRYR